ncbi:MAG: 23S rRNA (guanosine(2251)-2'-O)-methyltransferase RlmB [Oscillospiraceae bacterium]
MEDLNKRENVDFIAGRNAVIEALKQKRNIDTIYITNAQTHGSINKIIALAKENDIVIKNVTDQKLDFISGGVNHQGVVAICAVGQYYSLEDILQIARDKNEPPFIIIADEIEDPHNLGAIIRTAEACGAHGIIIPKRRTATLTSTVYKTSAGAASAVPVAKVPNLVAAIKELQKNGVWIYAADMDGKRWCEVDLKGAVALIIGSEGEGISRLLKEQCDFTLSLPMLGTINSLNASVAAGILMYEVVRQRTNNISM